MSEKRGFGSGDWPVSQSRVSAGYVWQRMNHRERFARVRRSLASAPGAKFGSVPFLDRGGSLSGCRCELEARCARAKQQQEWIEGGAFSRQVLHPSPPAPLPQGERGAQSSLRADRMATVDALSPMPEAQATSSPSPLEGEGLGRGGKPGRARWAALRLAHATWRSFVWTPPHRSRCSGCEARDALRSGAFARPVVPRAGMRAGGISPGACAMMRGPEDH